MEKPHAKSNDRKTLIEYITQLVQTRRTDVFEYNGHSSKGKLADELLKQNMFLMNIMTQFTSQRKHSPCSVAASNQTFGFADPETFRQNIADQLF